MTFAELRARAQHANEILRDHFLTAEVSPTHAETLRQWSYRIPRDGISQATAATTRRSQYPLRADAADAPFNFNSEMFDPPRTEPAPPVPAQRSDFHSSSVKDILHPWAVSAIDAWFAREEADLLAYAANPLARRHTNKPFVIDQDGCFPRAQGLFWDLSGPVPQLMRRDAPGTSRLNADAIRSAAGPAYPDQELLDGIQHGVRMPADHQMCIVLLPNLISIAAGMLQHHADVARMEAEHVLSVQASIPFIPGVLLPQGSTGKVHEPDKRRRTGAPRTPLVSRAGTAIVPINVSVLTPREDGSSPLQQERKPRLSFVTGDAEILNSAANALEDDGEPPAVCRIYAACDDFKAFFNQFGLHTSDLSRFLMTILRKTGSTSRRSACSDSGAPRQAASPSGSPTSSARRSPRG
jgi:hypothetical protein